MAHMSCSQCYKAVPANKNNTPSETGPEGPLRAVKPYMCYQAPTSRVRVFQGPGIGKLCRKPPYGHINSKPALYITKDRKEP